VYLVNTELHRKY